MKYCKKCGMLLEDTHEHCIKCGADVTDPENVSMYPIEVMETLEEESERKKASGKIVAMIIGLVVALVILTIFFVNAASHGALKVPETKEDTSAEVSAPSEAPEEEEVTPAPAEPEETPVPKSDRKVKDDAGEYYDLYEGTDDAGNVVFTALLPEDLSDRQCFNDYEIYSDRYPYSFMFEASTKANDVRFTYLSPKKLWFKQSDSGKSRTNEADVSHYMTYFQYDGAKSYLEPLLEQSYPGAKFEIKDEYDVDPATVGLLADFAKARNKELFKPDQDYAFIGAETSYANMNYESFAKVYKYEITLPDKNMLFCKYYVPVMAHNVAYADKKTNDKGTITEWYNFALIGFETGNEDEYDDYEKAFDIFVANAIPTGLYMYINESYSKEIKEAVNSFESVVAAQMEALAEDEAEEEKIPELEEADPLTKEKLEKYGKEYKPSDKPDDFDSKVLEILTSVGVCFKGSDINVYGMKDAKVAFFDPAKKKVFISPEEDEFPGDQYEELARQDKPEASAEEGAADKPEDAPEDKPEDKPKDKPAGGVE